MLFVLAILQSGVPARPWEKLRVGTLLAHGRRTVTAALRPMGRGAATDYRRYHAGLNRAPWSPLPLRRLRLQALRTAVVAAGGSLIFVSAETRARRWGPPLRKRGPFRAAWLASRKKSISHSSLALDRHRAGRPCPLNHAPRGAPRAERRRPFTQSEAATPAPPQNGRPRGAAAGDAGAARWLPGGARTVLGAGAYRAVALGLRGQTPGVTLSAPLVLNAQLCEPPPPPAGKKRAGRPPEKGAHLPNLSAVLVNPPPPWEKVAVKWYDGPKRALEITTGTARWKRAGGPGQQTAWYEKAAATLSDTLATVRRQLWGNCNYLTSPPAPAVPLIPQKDLLRLTQPLCYSH